MSDNSRQQSNTGPIVGGSILSAISFAAFAAIIVGSILVATLPDALLVPIILITGGFVLFIIFGFVAYHFWDVLAEQKVRGAKAMKICSTVQHFLLYYFLYMAGAIIGGIIKVVCILLGKEPSHNSQKNQEETFSVTVNGFERTLERDGLAYFGSPMKGHPRYRDDLGNYWCSDDGGRTFYRAP